MTNQVPSAIEIIQELNTKADPQVYASQSRFGIKGHTRLGISIYDLRRMAKGLKSHELASQLWQSGIHEARILAAMIDEPEIVSLQQLEEWVKEFDSWDICDVVTDELFIHVPEMLSVIPLWANREEEYVKRAAFTMIAALVVHRSDIRDDVVKGFFPLMETASSDERNFVKKAVNWALRNIGKWRAALRPDAIACAQRLCESEHRSAQWIGKDALKEFTKKFGGINETGIKA